MIFFVTKSMSVREKFPGLSELAYSKLSLESDELIYEDGWYLDRLSITDVDEDIMVELLEWQIIKRIKLDEKLTLKLLSAMHFVDEINVGWLPRREMHNFTGIKCRLLIVNCHKCLGAFVTTCVQFPYDYDIIGEDDIRNANYAFGIILTGAITMKEHNFLKDGYLVFMRNYHHNLTYTYTILYSPFDIPRKEYTLEEVKDICEQFYSIKPRVKSARKK